MNIKNIIFSVMIITTTIFNTYAENTTEEAEKAIEMQVSREIYNKARIGIALGASAGGLSTRNNGLIKCMAGAAIGGFTGMGVGFGLAVLAAVETIEEAKQKNPGLDANKIVDNAFFNMEKNLNELGVI